MTCPQRAPRRAGVLLHPTSLPGRYGIGDFGWQARRFIDLIAEARQGLWQIMPLGPAGPGNSPYAARSSFAFNPLLVSPDSLAERGWLVGEDLDGAPGADPGHVDFDAVKHWKRDRLHRAFERYQREPEPPDFADFREAAAAWLPDFCLFMALRARHGWWAEWPEGLRRRDPLALAEACECFADAIRFHEFVQWCAHSQWVSLRQYANERGVEVVGDIPIFVDHNSADVWAHQEIFKLDERGLPFVVAGVPPDAFSSTGQRWGNPLYDWDRLRDRGYDWWIDRFRWMLHQVDIVRIDHFRGFQAAWEVPAHEHTAENGYWVHGPGRDFFDHARHALGNVPIVVEDLGLITDDVRALRDELGYPGMDVLQFAFGDDARNPYLPHNVCPSSIMYTGTHDNDTTAGWLATLDPASHTRLTRYLGHEPRDVRDIIRLAYASVAETAIVPMQDVLGLGSEARMNVPGQADGNWTWRMTEAQMETCDPAWLRELGETYGRVPGVNTSW
ncbi:MAG: 4-alpha-glucanotransferase [Dehalococcoidia bacterium]|nr:4-alpha-glucanotransferase [Dehalococcoidia bacterium]